MPNNVIDLKKRFPKRFYNIDLEAFEALPPDDFLYRLEKLFFRPHLFSVRSAKVVTLDAERDPIEFGGWENDRDSSAQMI